MKPSTRRQQVPNRPRTGTPPTHTPVLASPARRLPGHPTPRTANSPQGTTQQGRQSERNKPRTGHEQVLNRSPRHKATPLYTTQIDIAAQHHETTTRSAGTHPRSADPRPTPASSRLAPTSPSHTFRTSTEQAPNKPSTSPPATNIPPRPSGLRQPASAGFLRVDRRFSAGLPSTSPPGTNTPPRPSGSPQPASAGFLRVDPWFSTGQRFSAGPPYLRPIAPPPDRRPAIVRATEQAPNLAIWPPRPYNGESGRREADAERGAGSAMGRATPSRSPITPALQPLPNPRRRVL
jgi:hypothetical protein